MNTNALLIYYQLLNAGLTEAGALGLMGNWMAESGLEANRLQSDFTQGRTHSKAYTEDVMSGRIGRTEFSRDQRGYGLAQWTYYTRKEALYDFWKNSGCALDDVRMQVNFALHELSTGGEYAGLWSVLRTTDDIWTATDKICRLYERPYYNNVDARFRYAKDLESELPGTESEPPAESSPAITPPSAAYWPPRMVDKNMSGSDVAVLQALLYARGLYGSSIDGKFGDELDKAVRGFQRDHGLTVDGVVGPQTWSALLRQS